MAPDTVSSMLGEKIPCWLYVDFQLCIRSKLLILPLFKGQLYSAVAGQRV